MYSVSKVALERSCDIFKVAVSGILTWSIGVALAEGGIGEAHGAVADNHKAWQAAELRFVH